MHYVATAQHRGEKQSFVKKKKKYKKNQNCVLDRYTEGLGQILPHVPKVSTGV